MTLEEKLRKYIKEQRRMLAMGHPDSDYESGHDAGREDVLDDMEEMLDERDSK